MSQLGQLRITETYYLRVLKAESMKSGVRGATLSEIYIFFKFYFIFKLYIIVLVLPNIKMNILPCLFLVLAVYQQSLTFLGL